MREEAREKGCGGARGAPIRGTAACALRLSHPVAGLLSVPGGWAHPQTHRSQLQRTVNGRNQARTGGAEAVRGRRPWVPTGTAAAGVAATCSAVW